MLYPSSQCSQTLKNERAEKVIRDMSSLALQGNGVLKAWQAHCIHEPTVTGNA